MKEKEKHLLIAQMMRLASFGLVSSAAALPKPKKIWIVLKYIVSIN